MDFGLNLLKRIECWLCDRPIWESRWHPRIGDYKNLVRVLPKFCSHKKCKVKQYKRQFERRIWEM